MAADVLVVGIGNILKADDGIGVRVIEYLAGSKDLVPDWMELIDGGTLGYDLLEPMSCFSRIVIVDAMVADSPSGTVYRFSPDEISGPGDTFSLHGFGVKSIIDMLKVGGYNPEIIVIGVVPEDVSSYHIGLSPAVAEAVEAAAGQVLAAARELHERCE